MSDRKSFQEILILTSLWTVSAVSPFFEGPRNFDPGVNKQRDV
jgi:hypothetical protein